MKHLIFEIKYLVFDRKNIQILLCCYQGIGQLASQIVLCKCKACAEVFGKGYCDLSSERIKWKGNAIVRLGIEPDGSDE